MWWTKGPAVWGIGLTAAGLMLVVGFDFDVVRTLIALAVMSVLLKTGFAVVGSFARPVPEPPPPGELRKVRLTFRCSICNTEVRMTAANDEMPEPPRHCLEDMVVVPPLYD